MRAGLVTALLVGCYSPTPPAGSPCPNDVCPTGLVCSPATKTCEKIGIDAAVAIDAAHDAALDAPGSTYLYRRRISIQNASTSALPIGFTIRLPLGMALATLVSQGKVKPDVSDLRIIGDGVLGERDRVIDPPTGPAPAAASFSLGAAIAPGTTSAEYAMYYGRPGATSAPANGAAVFPVFDDFTTGIASIWLQHGAPTTNAGQLVLRANQTDALVTTATTDGLPIVSAVELVVTVPDPTSNPTPQAAGTFYYWFGYQRTGDFTEDLPWVIWVARAKGKISDEQKSPVGCETLCPSVVITQDTARHYFVIERDPTETRFYRDGTLSHTVTVMNTEDYSVIVRNYMATSDLQVDWIRARARVTPDPSVTLGAEENL